MPSPATLLASFSPRNVLDSQGRLQDSMRLTDALAKYQSDADLESLRRAYVRYQKNQEVLKKPHSLIEATFRGFFSFKITPSNAYNSYISVVKNREDVDAIRADWEKVGEYLSFAIINKIIEEEKTNE